MRSTSCAAERGRACEAGTAIVEFLAVALLIVVCLLALAQLAIWVWARDVAVSAVHEGARTAAEAGRPMDDGVARTRALLHDGLGAGADHFAVDGRQDGDAVAVRAAGSAPRIVPFLPAFDIDVRADAYDEDAVLP